jgi:nucleoid-associated protein EbfC
MNKFKDLYQLQKQAKQIKEKLQNTHIEAEIEGVKAVVDGQQEIIHIEISDDAMTDKKKLQEKIVKALNKAIKRSQQIGAEEMKGVMGDMGLGGSGFPGT